MLKLWREIGHDARWVMASFTLWGVGEGLWLYIQPLYVKSLGATPSQTGFVIGMWGLARLLFILPTGILADRWGARRLMLPGWYVGLAGGLLIGLAPDWRWAAPGFFVYGISSAAIPATYLYLAQSARHDPTRHPNLPIQASMTMLWATYALGLIPSPTIGGLIGDWIGLRAVFLIGSFWFLLSTLAIFRTRPYPIPPTPAKGYDYRGLLSQWSVILPFAITTLGFIWLYVGQTLAPQFLEDARHFSPSTIGSMGSLIALGTVIFSLRLGVLSSWRGFFVSLCIVIVGFLLLLTSGAWPVVAVGYFLVGAYNTARPMAVSIISERVNEHQRGMAYALLDTLAGLASVVGSNLAGILYGYSPNWPFEAAIGGIIAVIIGGGLVQRQIVPRHSVDSVLVE